MSDPRFAPKAWHSFAGPDDAAQPLRACARLNGLLVETEPDGEWTVVHIYCSDDVFAALCTESNIPPSNARR